MQPRQIKATSPAEMLAAVKAKAEAYANATPEEREEIDRKNREAMELFRKTGGTGAAIMVGGKGK